MKFIQRKGGMREAPAPEAPKVKDDRPAPGASATLSNVGPEKRPARDAEDMDVVAGTTSGMNMHGTPKRGSREGQIR